MGAIGMTGDVTLGTFACILASERQDVTTVTTPVGAEVRNGFESMWDAVVELDFVSIGFGVALRDTLCDDFLRALLVASVATVLALTSSCVEQEFATERATKHLVELTRDEFVTVDLGNILLALTESSLSTETGIIGTFADVLLDEIEPQVNSPGRLDGEPGFNTVCRSVGDIDTSGSVVSSIGAST